MENMNVMNNEAIETVEETVVSSGSGWKKAGLITLGIVGAALAVKGIKAIIAAKKAKSKEDDDAINVEAEVVDEFTEENDKE